MTASSRSQVPPFAVMEIIAAANARRAQGHRVLSLCAGEPAAGAPAAVRRRAEELLAGGGLGYTEAVGIPALRAEIAAHYHRWYGVDLDPRRVAVTTGASGGFLLAFLSAFDAGDRVTLARPGYPAYRNILTSLGARVVELPCGPATRYQPTVAQLDALEEPVAGLVVAGPANPTGTLVDGAGLRELVDWCAEHRVRLISDEIYHGITYPDTEGGTARHHRAGAPASDGAGAPAHDGEAGDRCLPAGSPWAPVRAGALSAGSPWAPVRAGARPGSSPMAPARRSGLPGEGGPAGAPTVAAALGDGAVVVSSFSKYWAMTGWRLGWLLLPDDLIAPVDALAGNLALCPPALAQHAAVAAFDASAYREAEENVARYAQSRRLVLDRLPELGWAQVAPAQGAFYVYADISPTGLDSGTWCARLLEEAGVALTPGTDFDRAGGRDWVRLSFAADPAVVAEAVDRVIIWQQGL